MPAYNEAANIEAVVEQWHRVVDKIGQGSKLVIFNDGSKDDTYSIMHELELRYPHFEAIDKPNSGHGSTCLQAYHHAINAGADWIFQTDSDGQTEPDEFFAFWDKRNNYDFIVGSRVGRQDGFSRKVVTKTLKAIVWIVFGERVIDCNTPFRLMKAEKLEPILNIVPKDFFLSNVIISMLIVKRNERSLWLPITFKPRQGGVNSINLKRIFKIGVQSIRDFRQINKSIKSK